MRTVIQDSGLPTINDGTASAQTSSCQTSLSKKKVLLMGLDGVRADVAMLPLPNIHRLQSIGTYSWWADVQSSATAVSGPCWCSIFTGVEASKHKVGSNNDLNDCVSYPTVFKLVKDTFGKKVAASVSWDPLIDDIIDYEDPSTLDAKFLGDLDDEAVAAKAEQWIKEDLYDFIFVALDGPDEEGHETGFDGYNSAYQNSVLNADMWVGKWLDAVLEVSDGEEWLLIVVSDHGGEGTGHGASNAENRKVPLIVASNSPQVQIGEVTIDDPGSNMDVLSTIMYFLGGKDLVPPGLDGQVFGFKDYIRVQEGSAIDAASLLSKTAYRDSVERQHASTVSAATKASAVTLAWAFLLTCQWAIQ